MGSSPAFRYMKYMTYFELIVKGDMKFLLNLIFVHMDISVFFLYYFSFKLFSHSVKNQCEGLFLTISPNLSPSRSALQTLMLLSEFHKEA